LPRRPRRRRDHLTALYDGPLSFTITAHEAGQLAAAITTQLAANRANPDAWPRSC
jgi:hypothetical protein